MSDSEKIVLPRPYHLKRSGRAWWIWDGPQPFLELPNGPADGILAVARRYHEAGEAAQLRAFLEGVVSGMLAAYSVRVWASDVRRTIESGAAND